MTRVELAYHPRAELGEGPRWDPVSQRLIWVDVNRGHVHLYELNAGADRAIKVGQAVGVAVPRAKGGLMLAVADGFAALDLTLGTVELLVPVERERADMRMNDGACDPAGRFWAGTMSISEAPGMGALYRLDPDLRVKLVLEGVSISNGIGWSPDGSLMYYVDTPTRRIDVFDFDPRSGEAGNRRPFVVVSSDTGGVPDGLTVDADAAIWVALWGGGEVHRYTASGTLDAVVKLPASRPTSCCFAGPALDHLFITSASIGVDSTDEPVAGAVFVCVPGAVGMPAHAFAG